MHLEVTKDNKWRNWGGKKFFFDKKFFISEFFFHQILCHLGHLLLKIAKRKNWISKWGNPGGKRTPPMRQALQKMVADAEKTRNGAAWEVF